MVFFHRGGREEESRAGERRVHRDRYLLEDVCIPCDVLVVVQALGAEYIGCGPGFRSGDALGSGHRSAVCGGGGRGLQRAGGLIAHIWSNVRFVLGAGLGQHLLGVDPVVGFDTELAQDVLALEQGDKRLVRDDVKLIDGLYAGQLAEWQAKPSAHDLLGQYL